MKKIQVPEGMLSAAIPAATAAIPAATWRSGLRVGDQVRLVLEAALRWQREDVEPKLDALLRRYLGDGPHDISNMRTNILNMFCPMEPEIPEEIKDLLWNESPAGKHLPAEEGAGVNARKLHNKALLEAYRRGKASK